MKKILVVIQKQMSTEAKEQEILLNAIVNSGDLKAANALYDLIAEKRRIQRENKSLRQLIKQLEIGIILIIVGVVIWYLLFLHNCSF